MNRRIVYQNVLASILFLGALVSFNGCVYLLVGGVGALGGYAISSDTVQGTIERDNKEVWEAASTVVNIMGKLNKETEETGRLEAIVDGARVTVGVAQFTPKLVKLTVKARKSFFPNIATAQSVYMKIISYLGK